MKKRTVILNSKMTMIYWRPGKFWLGKLVERPDIMTQGRTVQELVLNIRDAYRLMTTTKAPSHS